VFILGHLLILLGNLNIRLYAIEGLYMVCFLATCNCVSLLILDNIG